MKREKINKGNKLTLEYLQNKKEVILKLTSFAIDKVYFVF